MTIKIIALCLFVLVANLVFFFSTKVEAGGANEVRPVILIPKDWKERLKVEDLDQYKSNAISALSEVQRFYSQKLNGKTFKFSNNVEVVNSPKGIEGVPQTTAYNIFVALDGFSVLPAQGGIVYAVWIIGSYSGTRNGGEILGGSYTYLTNEDLINSAPGENQVFRNGSIGVLAHELGHAFGLVFSGFANAHPCSEISQKECVINAPKPLPLGEEYSNDIMGFFGNYPNAGFNNTTYNPEITKIFKSPFINPENEAPPFLENSSVPGSSAKIEKLDPNRVKEGDMLTIRGSGFGEEGRVEFFAATMITTYRSNFNIIQWTDDRIDVLIGEENPNLLNTLWKVRVIKKDGDIITTDEDLVILGVQSAIPVAVDFSVTCGPDKKPMSGVEVSLRQVKQNVVLTKVVSDGAGKGVITYPFHLPSEGNLILVSQTINGLTPTQTIEIPSTGATHLKTVADFNYPECVVITQPSPTASLFPVPTPSGRTASVQPEEEQTPLEQIYNNIQDALPFLPELEENQSQQTQEQSQEQSQEPSSENNSGIVKAYILAPEGYSDTEKLSIYKQNIISALKTVQNWYGQNLDNHTFALDDSVTVVYSDQLNYNDPLLIFSGFEKDIPQTEGVVRAIWIIGLNGGAAVGGPDGNSETGYKNSGGVAIPESDIISYDGRYGEYQKNNSSGTLAMELGHAFGIYGNYGGYAQSHTCTQITPRNCSPDAPTPLPDASEAYGSVMNSEGASRFPDTGFANSIHNPEVWRLYQSPFINPQNDPAPAPKPWNEVASVPEAPLVDEIELGQPSETEESDFVEKIEIETNDGRVDITNEDSFEVKGDYATLFIIYSSGKVRILTYRFEKLATVEETVEPEVPSETEQSSCPEGCNLIDGVCWEGPVHWDENNQCPKDFDSYDDGCWRRCE